MHNRNHISCLPDQVREDTEPEACLVRQVLLGQAREAGEYKMDWAVGSGVGYWSPVNISVTVAWHTNEASRKPKLAWKGDGWGFNPACPFASSLIFPGVRLASDSQFSDFLDGLGPAQLVGRQTLATPAMGKSLCHVISLFTL